MVGGGDLSASYREDLTRIRCETGREMEGEILTEQRKVDALIGTLTSG